jgi:hypothetical protein
MHCNLRITDTTEIALHGEGEDQGFGRGGGLDIYVCKRGFWWSGSSMTHLRDFYVIVDFPQYTLRGLHITGRLRTSLLV